MFNFKKKKGFTLTEVLIVIGIIGIVSAAVIPIMVAKSTKEQYVSNLQKMNSTLTSITNYAQSTGSTMDSWNYNGSATAFAESYILPGLSVAETCGTESGKGCFASKYQYRNGGESDIDGDTDYYKLVLTDGNSLAIKPFTGCLNTTGAQCVSFIVDVNGSKEPNVWGKDVFEFEIISGMNSIIPFGTFSGYDATQKEWMYTDQETVDSQCGTGTGRYCALKIINDGWEIKYF